MKQLLKRSIALAVIAIMLLTSVACSSEPVTSGGDTTTTSTATEDGGSEDAGSGEMTMVNTLRSETLIVEMQSATAMPGIFSPYVTSLSLGSGIHQMMMGYLWQMDTQNGVQIPEIAADFPTSNEDYTVHTIPIREGLKWSDGEDLNAEDVAFTFNKIMESTANPSAYFNDTFESVEATGEYEVTVTTKMSFPRLSQRFGVTIWGNDLKIIPEHYYKDVGDLATHTDGEQKDIPVSGPYTVSDFDDLGNWILFERREDWESSVTGHLGEPGPKYVLFRALGDNNARQMAFVNNEVDIMVEVTPEMFEDMKADNDKLGAWYNEFPYSTSDDPCSKGLVFSHAQGAPYDNPDFRWGITLALNIDDISMNIFQGAGRMSPVPILTATQAMQDIHLEPLLPFLESFELDLGDGTTLKPWDNTYAQRMYDTLTAEGRSIPSDEESLKNMFGLGWWKHDPEAAEKLLIKAGLEKVDGIWHFEGEPFTFVMTRIADTEEQAGRGVDAAYQQLLAFGFDVTFAQENSTTWNTNGTAGTFDIGGYWPTGGITEDIYSQISGYANDLIVPMGEIGSGQGMRWDNQEVTDIINEMEVLSPVNDREELLELSQDFLEICVEEMPMITFHSGVKLVPTNSTYWTNYPTAENDYNGPWWWWSTFKYVLPELTPAA